MMPEALSDDGSSTGAGPSPYSGEMDWQGWLGIGGLIIGVLGVGVAIWGRAHPVRGTLLFTTADEPLDIPAGADLTVMHGDTPVAHPRIMTARFENLGPTDLTPSSILGGRLHVYTEPGTVLSVSASGAELSIDRGPDRDCITIAPRITPPGEAITVTAVAAGETHAQHSATVAGFTVRTKPTSIRSAGKVQLGIVGVVVGALAVVYFPVAGGYSQLPPTITGALLMVLGALLVVALTTYQAAGRER